MSGNNVRAWRTDHQKVAAVSDVRSLKSGLEEDALNDILKNLSICSKNAVQDTADEKDRRTSEGDLPEPIGVKKQKGHETILAHPFRLYDEPIQPKIAALAAQTSPYQPSAKSSYFDMFKGKKVSFKDGLYTNSSSRVYKETLSYDR
ncbi:hypothetical protein NCC49_000597 [Naganishia albida]|nr:hypothetical protein NCC49_000597 [Naganishia albida]